MARTFILFLFIVHTFLSGASSLMAQTKEATSQTLEKAQIRVIYEVKKKATKANETIELIDTMALDVGAKWSDY